MSRQKFQTPRWTVVAFLLLLTIALVPFPARAQTQITYAVWGSPEAIPMWERDIALFEAAHPDIRVNLLFSSWDQYWERMPFYLSGEIEVDVIQLGGQHVTAYASQGLLLPLTPYVESGELDLEPYFPQVAAIGRYNDTLYAFPDTFSPVILYFNIDLFEAYGLETPYELYLRAMSERGKLSSPS